MIADSSTSVGLDRYARQCLLPGWEQDILTRSRVALVGSGLLVGYVAWGLAALGVGEIYLVDHNRVHVAGARFPYLEAMPNQPAAQALASTLRRINPHIVAYPLVLRLLYDAHAFALPACDVIVEASADLQSKAVCLEFSRRNGVPLILAAAGPGGGECRTVLGRGPVPLEPYRVYRELSPAPIPSQVIAGLVLDEVRKLVLPLPGVDEHPATGPICYRLPCLCRSGAADSPAATVLRFDGYRALIVGAGALGTYTSLALAPTGMRLAIFDPDIIEETNLNRQVLFYDGIGRPKATELADKLRRIVPGAQVVGSVGRVRPRDLEDADVIFLCVDNFGTRAEVNDWSVQLGKPIINGGTGPYSGDVKVYRPGETACLECALGVSQLAEAEEGVLRCGQIAEPSVVISNQITGGLMAGEVGTVLQPDRCGPPIRGVIEYSSMEPTRIGVRSPRPACLCHKGGAR